MLKNFDFKKRDTTYDLEDANQLQEKLALLQRELHATEKSVLIIVDGWESSGKGYILKEIVHGLDPRYFEVSVFDTPSDEEKNRPFLWRFMRRIPPHGNIAVFDRSFYLELMDDLNIADKSLDKKVGHISNIEEWLSNDGMLILKFFLHHKEKTMKKRIEKLKDNEDYAVYLNRRDKTQLENYKAYKKHFNRILERTHREKYPWHILSTEDLELAAKNVLGIAIQEIEKHLQRDLTAVTLPELPEYTEKPLDKIDFTKTISNEEYDKKIDKLQKKAERLVLNLYRQKKAAIVAFEGADAAGKGGAIQRLLKEVDPRGYDVATTAAPKNGENLYHYLWRFYKTFPPKGRLTVYDRTWYGRVLVERIEGFTPEYRWQQAYGEINEMEKTLADDGILIMKFLLVINEEEQKRRFEAREGDPMKQYKITDEDWRNREKFQQYTQAMNDMVAYTDKKNAPWIVVDAQVKKYARIKVLEEFTDRMEKYLGE